MASKEGISFAQDLGIRDAILEGHAKVVMDSFEKGPMNLFHNGLILLDKYNITFSFSYFKVQFVIRKKICFHFF